VLFNNHLFRFYFLLSYCSSSMLVHIGVMICTCTCTTNRQLIKIYHSCCCWLSISICENLLQRLRLPIVLWILNFEISKTYFIIWNQKNRLLLLISKVMVYVESIYSWYQEWIAKYFGHDVFLFKRNVLKDLECRPKKNFNIGQILIGFINNL